ncbi:MAG: zinc ribbon domain-containing protein [Eggerthellaceae bacterium]|nr:zinc ribbon domain-containing protein [Eggerthellaceae bacterium]
MPLITCPDCGHQVSDRASFCPNCGCPSSAWQIIVGIPSSLRVGQRFTMGNWGGEPIEWRVLQVSGSRAYVISVCGLDCVQFNASQDKGNSWCRSDLKAWLENTFLPGAFSPSERAAIQEVTCLSIEEVKSLFLNDDDRSCRPTEFAVQRGISKGNPTGGCWWWLRSPGKDGPGCAACVVFDGMVSTYGWRVDSSSDAVRPALWLNL